MTRRRTGAVVVGGTSRPSCATRHPRPAVDGPLGESGPARDLSDADKVLAVRTLHDMHAWTATEIASGSPYPSARSARSSAWPTTGAGRPRAAGPLTIAKAQEIRPPRPSRPARRAPYVGLKAARSPPSAPPSARRASTLNSPTAPATAPPAPAVSRRLPLVRHPAMARRIGSSTHGPASNNAASPSSPEVSPAVQAGPASNHAWTAHEPVATAAGRGSRDRRRRPGARAHRPHRRFAVHRSLRRRHPRQSWPCTTSR